MYLLSSDNWMRENMYHSYECGAWYSASFQKGDTKEWCLSFGKKGRIQEVTVGGRDQWVMYGPAYFSREFTAEFLPVDVYKRQVSCPSISTWAIKRLGRLRNRPSFMYSYLILCILPGGRRFCKPDLK